MTSGPFLKFCHNWFSKPYSQHDLQAMYCLNRTPVLPHVIGNSPCRGCHGFWQLDVFRMEPIFKLFAAGFVGNCFNSSGCHCKKVKWWRPKEKKFGNLIEWQTECCALLFWSPVFPTSVSNDSKRIKMRQHLLQFRSHFGHVVRSLSSDWLASTITQTAPVFYYHARLINNYSPKRR